MNLLQILTNFVIDYWYIIPLLILISVIKTSWFKGVFGELLVNVLARIMLDKEKYHLIKNVTLPTENGTTQIDHVIVSEYGVFVVETKNLKGWIFGTKHQKKWTQQIFKHKSHFQNPLHQNYKHTKTLATLLSIDEASLFSLIVFIGDSTFKTKMPINVTHGTGYIKYIKSKTQRVLTESQVQKSVKMIRNKRLTQSLKTNKEHVNHVKKIVAEKENNLSCDLCGELMVVREVKKGQNIGKKFWGCSGFPKCRSTKQLDNS